LIQSADASNENGAKVNQLHEIRATCSRGGFRRDSRQRSEVSKILVSANANARMTYINNETAHDQIELKDW
jgi:hypothetical protein